MLNKPDVSSTSFQQNIDIDLGEDEIDERIPGESFLKNRAKSINESVLYNKRSMSEMQKSVRQAISITKATNIASTNRFKDKSKNQFNLLVNGVKTIELNNLTETTKSGNPSSTRQRINSSKTGLVHSSYSGQNLKINSENSNIRLNSSGNNNSISSLRLNDKALMFDLGNQTKTESLYSPLARDRSNTIN